MSICILNVVSINECNVPDQFKISEMTTFLILNNTFSLMSFKTTIAFVSHMTLLIQTVSKRPLLLISPSENWGLWILYHFTALQLLMTGSQIVPICITLYLFIINFKLICFNFFDRLFFFTFLFSATTPAASFMSCCILIKHEVYYLLSKLSIKTVNRTGKRLLGWW